MDKYIKNSVDIVKDFRLSGERCRGKKIKIEWIVFWIILAIIIGGIV